MYMLRLRLNLPFSRRLYRWIVLCMLVCTLKLCMSGRGSCQKVWLPSFQPTHSRHGSGREKACSFHCWEHPQHRSAHALRCEQSCLQRMAPVPHVQGECMQSSAARVLDIASYGKCCGQKGNTAASGLVCVSCEA